MNVPTYKALSLEHYAAIQPSDSKELHKALYNSAVLPAMHEITIYVIGVTQYQAE